MYKLLIFILSVILLIVVIKFMRGGRPREGFSQVRARDFYKMPSTNALSSDLEYKDLESLFLHNPGTMHSQQLPKGLKYGDKLTYSYQKKHHDGTAWRGDDEKFIIMTNKVDFSSFFKRIAFNFGVLKREIDKLNRRETSTRQKYEASLSEIKGLVTANTDNITANKDNIAKNTASITTNTSSIAKNTDNIAKNTASITTNTSSIGLLENNLELLEANTSSGDALKEFITKQAGRDSKQDKNLVKIKDFDNYKKTKQITDKNQAGAHKVLNDKFQTYQAAQAKKDSEQDVSLTTLSVFKGAHDAIHTKLNEDISSYRTTHAMMHETEKTRVKKNYDDLEKWTQIFKTAQAELGFKVKCQGPDGNWGIANEHCPKWLQGKSPS